MSKLSGCQKSLNCMQAEWTIKMRRGRDAQGKVMDLSPSPRYVVGRKEVRRFFCDGEHDQWVLYLSSTLEE